MTFDLLLAKYQKMYNVYRNKGEEFSENAKVRLLFKMYIAFWVKWHNRNFESPHYN